MLIKKLYGANFRGLQKFDYEFSSEACMFFGPNGVGKTSSLDALRFALTGKMPADMLYHGASEGYVGIVFNDDDGTYVERRFFAGDKPNKVRLNGKACTAKAAQAVICEILGCDDTKLQTITSHEVFLQLINEDLGAFLRSFIAETFSTEKLLEMVSFSDDELKVLKPLLGVDFDISEIDSVYKELYDERAGVSKTRDEIAVKFDTSAELPEPYYKDEEALKADEETYLLAKATKSKAEAETRAYERALAEYRNRLVILKNLKKSLAEAGEPEFVSDEIIADKETALSKIQSELRSAVSAKGNAEAIVAQQTSFLEALASDKCPLSECLVCSTDKSCLKAEVKKSLDAAIKTVEELRTLIASLGAKEISTKNEISELRKKLKAFNDYSTLKRRVEEMESTLGSEPVLPVSASVDEAELELFEFRKAEFEEYVKHISARRIVEEKSTELEVLNSLVKKFHPRKGEVTNAVMQHYCDIFDEQAELIAPLFGYEIKFVAENGVKLFVKPKEGKQRVEFCSLSRGEKLTVSIVIYTVLNLLMGTGVMVIDNFNDLDEDAANRAVKIINSITRELGIEDIFVAGCVTEKKEE